MSEPEDEISAISKDILNRIQEEKKELVLQPAIGRTEFVVDGKPFLKWLTRKSIQMGALVGTDITGYPTPPTEAHKVTLKGGDSVSRDNKLGEFLIANQIGVGTFQHPSDNSSLSIDVRSLAVYIPDLYHADATDGSIKTVLVKNYTFRSLIEEIGLLRDKKKEVEDFEKRLKEDKEIGLEVEKLVSEIEIKKREIRELKEKIQRYIINSSSLKMRPILDREQDKIRRSKVLDGTLIIDGGPGTGKTTSLIQRITFLTASTIEEYKNDLTVEDKELLYDQDKSWVFFSPSELLRLYLKEAMIQEGLKADDNRVLVWNNHRDNLFKLFRLINPQSNRPFINYKSDVQFFNLNGKKTLKLLDDFNEFFIAQQQDKLKKIRDLKVFQFEWRETGLSIIDTLDKSKNLKFEDWISFYHLLYVNFYSKSSEINKEYTELINYTAAEAQSKIIQDEPLKNWLEEELNRLFKAKSGIEIEDDSEDDSEFDDENEEYILRTFDFKLSLFAKLKSIIRKLSFRLYVEKTSLTKVENEIFKKVEKYLNSENFNAIGQKDYYRKRIAKITKGYEFNVFRELPRAYKDYRREKLVKSPFLTQKGKLICKGIIKPENPAEKKDLRVHPEEKDLILSIVMNYIRKFYLSFPQHYAETKHHYVAAYKEALKVTIAVDEATDFSALQLFCMSLLSHPKFNCVTLSGDIMQRMRITGIKTWNEYKVLIPNTTIKSMKTTYRQTPILLNLAQKIYHHKLHRKADFHSYTEKDEFDPKPLLFRSESIEEKAKWISERIINIYNNYSGKIPTIAIFTKNDTIASEIAAELDKLELLNNSDLKVEACPNGKQLGDASVIRVFSIEYIKGMEFQAVFFIDIDQYDDEHGNILDKYLYVGLSRASFFLAVTINNEFPPEIKYIESDFFENISW